MSVPRIPSSVPSLWPVALTYLVLSAAAVYRYQAWPSVIPSADAMSYVEHGLAFRQFGLLSNFGTVRTYGYPLLIYLYSFIAGFKPPTIALVAGAIQLTLAASGSALVENDRVVLCSADHSRHIVLLIQDDHFLAVKIVF